MSWAFVTLPAISLVGGAAWYLTGSRRQQRDPQTLINCLHAKQLKNLDDFLSAEVDLISEDPEFWRCSGGTRGLIRKWQNARIIVQLCQHICVLSQLDPAVADEMTRRSLLIGLMVFCSLPEAFLRLFFSELPHLCARVATEIYSQMTGETQFLCLQYQEKIPLLASRIGAVL